MPRRFHHLIYNRLRDFHPVGCADSLDAATTAIADGFFPSTATVAIAVTDAVGPCPICAPGVARWGHRTDPPAPPMVDRS